MTDFPSWKPPSRYLVSSLSDIDPAVLADLRAHFESVDPIRVNANQIIGRAEYLERMDVLPSGPSISSSVAETTIYDYDVPAGLLQTKGGLWVQVYGRVLNDTGTGYAITVGITYGATEMWKDTSDAFSSTANWRPFGLEFVLFNAGTTAGQELVGKIGANSSSAPTTGFGAFLDAGGIAYKPIWGEASEDSTLLKTLQVKVTMGNTGLFWATDYGLTLRVSH